MRAAASVPRGALPPLILTGLCAAFAGACSDSAGPVYPYGVEVAPVDTSIKQLGGFSIRVVVYDSGGHPLPLRATLTSTDTSIVRVTPDGDVQSRGPIGFAFIVATVGPFTDFARVTVRDSTILERVTLSGGPLGIAVAGDVAYVSRAFAGKVQRLALGTLALTDSITVGSVPCFIVFNPTATKAYIANQSSQNVGIIDVSANFQAGVIPLNGDPLPVALTADGNTLFVTTNADRLYKVNLLTNAVVDSLPLPATSHHLLVHPNDTLLYVATRDAGSVLEVNWRTMTVARTFTLGGRTQGMALSPDKQELYVANELSNGLHIITLSNGALSGVGLAGGGEGLALSADGTKLYVGLVFDGRVQVINRVTRTIVKTFNTRGVPREIAVDAARQRVLVANESGWVDILP